KQVALERDLAGQALYLTRSSLMSDAWHALPKNVLAARSYFGFASWAETKATVWALFDVLNPHKGDMPIHPSTPISPFEQYLICKMRFKKEYDYSMLGNLFGRSRNVIVTYVKGRAAEWRAAGQDLTILDIDAHYLTAECPQEYRDTGFSNIGLLVDGKDDNCERIRKDSTLSRAQYSSKKSCSALRTLSYQTPAGLSCEHTPAYWGRASETALEKLWGSHKGLTPRRELGADGLPVSMLPLHKILDLSGTNAARTRRRQTQADVADEAVDAGVGDLLKEGLSALGLDDDEGGLALAREQLLAVGSLAQGDVDEALEAAAQEATLAAVASPQDDLEAW
ncbi:hypothetical protein B484DRAFT_440872, partial [Ochromonadaceae sp. CCMP2298]